MPENIDNKKLLNSKKYFDQALFTHKEYNSPQSVQGMWQAYGQMNAARISGRYTLAATGVLGVGLFLYKQYLKDQKKLLEKAREEHAKTIKEQEDTKYQLLYSLKAAEGKFKEVDSRIRAFYKADPQLVSTYENTLIKIEENAASEVECMKLKYKIE